MSWPDSCLIFAGCMCYVDILFVYHLVLWIFAGINKVEVNLSPIGLSLYLFAGWRKKPKENETKKPFCSHIHATDGSDWFKRRASLRGSQKALSSHCRDRWRVCSFIPHNTFYPADPPHRLRLQFACSGAWWEPRRLSKREFWIDKLGPRSKVTRIDDLSAGFH